jgi:hypothetical protein
LSGQFVLLPGFILIATCGRQGRLENIPQLDRFKQQVALPGEVRVAEVLVAIRDVNSLWDQLTPAAR